MCTVTRPGIASIASSTAVELMVSVLQHPKGCAHLLPSISPFLSLTPFLLPGSSSAHSDVPITSSGTSQTTNPDPVDPTLSSPLGIVPHQIRGFLAQFHNMKITGQASDLCTGCSRKVRHPFLLPLLVRGADEGCGGQVVEAYEKDGFEMLLQAFEDAKYLEKLTGLDRMYEESEEMMESVDWDEEVRPVLLSIV